MTQYTVTRLRLCTKVGDETHNSNEVSTPAALHPQQSYMGISLTNLDCLVGKDDDAFLPYISAEFYHSQYPHLYFVPYEDILGIGRKNQLHEGVYRVRCKTNNEKFVFKEPTFPFDIESQSN